MRSKLGNYKGEVIMVTGRVRDFGKFKGRDTILIVNVKMGNEQLCDHIWLPVCRRFRRKGIGDRVVFSGRVVIYMKGYKGGTKPLKKDYRFSNIKVHDTDEF